jgi:predicted nuclease with TOPRIM domain
MFVHMHKDILHLLKEELENTLIRHKLKGIKELQSIHDIEAQGSSAKPEQPVLTT